ncbi:uncharacterized protein [Littorina saxatilis]|uniref:Uncharacterized protein n=2 Tax=Littorina saxatilis TaxID=31220 RepID=A0AAN9BUS7_9CAEN
MGTQPPALVPVLALCMLMVPCAFAVVTEKMGNITFECPDGWKIDGPYCYLLVDVAMAYDDAVEMCEKYGSGLVHIQDEVEAMAVGMMAHDRGMSDWGLYWIANNQTDAEGVCEGFWDVGQPKDVNVSTPFYVAATAPMGRWQERDKASRLPFVCRTEACVKGTFRCRDGKKCISNKWLCDGEYDCDDQSDESACDLKCMFYKYESSGKLDQNTGYEAGSTCTWVIEGTEPGKPISIQFASVNVEADVDYVEVWTGGPSLMTSKLQERLTGSLTNKKVYGYNNFIIVRRVAGLSASGTGFVATWAPDVELAHMERTVKATDTWTELTSPHYGNGSLPRAFVRHYTVTTEEGSLITMEVMENELGEGFEYDPKTLSLVGDFGIFPDTYVSRSNMFSFYLVSNGCEGPEKFKARVKKGCSAEFSRANSFVTSPNAPPLHYPPSVTCTYTIRAPLGQQRAFQLRFTISELADEKDSVKVYDGDNNGSTELTPQAPNTNFLSTGSVVFVVFTSSLVQTNGFFYLSYNLACPAITNRDNMQMSSNDTHYDSEVTLSCNTGFAFAQEEFASLTEVGIRCGLHGKWNVSRLPSCQIIYCGVPEAIPNGFISEGSGNARYDDTVTYQCFQGFTMTGSNTSTCGDGSMWSARPTCEASQCPSLDPLVNGEKPTVTGSGTGFGTITNYTCNDGFDLVGSRYTLCQTNGNWSHPAPTCERIKCPIPDVHRAVLSPMDPVDFESNLTVTCNVGFVINGTSDQSKAFPCLPSGTFDFRRDVCVDKDECDGSQCTGDHQECQNTMGSFKCGCEDKYKDVNGSCEVIDRCADNTSGCDSERGNCTASVSKEDFTCECKPGYTLFTSDGVSGRSILSPEDGMTPGDVYYLNHTCVPKTCQSPPDVTNAEKLTNRTTHDFEDTVQYRCNFGYSISGTNPLKCNENGQWDDPPPSCIINKCEPLAATGLVLNIYPNSTTMPNDTVVLECNSDATDVPYNKTLFCEYDKGTKRFMLQGDKPHCPAVDCGDLTPMGGATFTVTEKGLGANFTFACQGGFVLEGTSTMGDKEVTCQKNGRWGLGNLTCNGERCMDPGTPGGMAQVSANFEVRGVVVYNCSRDGFMPDPMNRTCEYNTTSSSVYWDSSEPVCKDMADPSFTHCPTETIFVKPYQNASSEMTMEPSAQDNSGLVTMKVMPAWFSLDVPLPPGQYNVKYNASDAAGNSAACDFTIEVNDPSVLPMLNCSDYLTLEVNDSMSYTVNLKDHVSTDSGVMLSYAPAGHEVVTVGPNTVGKTPVRVTATDKFGFQRQCAFIVDIKPNKCLESFISSGLQNATKSCTKAGGGNLSCTVTCNSGFAFQSGATSMPYSCSGANEWSPSLPVEACVDTVVPEYTFEVMVRYGGFVNLQNCDIETRLREHIPTQKILCFYQLSNGTDTQMTFRVTNVEFFGINLDYLFANVSLGLNVDPPPTEKADLDSCASRMTVPANIEDMFSLTGVTCPGPSDQNFPAVDPTLVNNGQSCGAGMTQTKVDNVDKCVQCAPGNFYQESGASCEVCPDGQYQSEAGQTQCNVCSDGGQYSAQPRSSQDQCIAPCPLGFFNGVGQTEDADDQCIACPVDQYLDTFFAANCTLCPVGTTTSGVEGATDAGACIDKCGAGMYPVNNTQCAPCPRGYYKSSDGNEKCDACDMAKTTDSVGSISITMDCEDISPAGCQNGGTAVVDYHKTYCECPLGYTGDMCQDMVNACKSNPCYNGGACTSTGPNTFSCECQSNKQCDMVSVDIEYDPDNGHTPLFQSTTFDQETCKRLCIDTTDCAAVMYYVSADTTLCQLFNATEYTNGTKQDNWETFLKSCAKTFLFEGSRCEKDLTDDCTNATCAERSFCRDMVGSADCVCPSDSKYTRPRCEIDDTVCDPNPCKNGGTCEDSGSGVRATCVCPAGFTGSMCEVDIDECAENPDGCLYGGNCTQAVNTYSCQCGDYSGDHCENKPDFCANNPTFCKNGLCYNDYNISSLVCVCEFPYKLGAGGQCEEIDICMEDNPCLHNSTCTIAAPGVTSCQCMDGYTGSRCQHNVNDCESMPCTNGMCMDLVNGYTCQCDSGFTLNGTNCVNIDDCGNCTFGNTDKCEDLVNDYRCVCKVGFKGKDCEINIDECMSMPCQHNGSCTQSSTTPGQYNCSCVDGWTGHNCENLDEFCTSSPCQSGGECYSLQDEYFCDCVGGSSGTNCEESRKVCSILNPCTPTITCQDADGTAKCPCPTSYTGSSCNLIEDSCSNSPCQNGGTCMLNNLGHTCHCAEGFSGTNCTTVSSACDSVTCPSGITCVEVLKEAVCLCGAQQLKSGDSCKNASNDFDMYFARRGKAVRSIQPVKLTKDVMTVMFWLAPMVNTTEAPVQLKQSNGTNVLSVFRGSVMFGDGAPVKFSAVAGEQSFDKNTWNQFSVTWNATSYELYLNGNRLQGGTHVFAFPPQNEFMFIYIGEDFEGYVSQLSVWERRVNFTEVLTMYGAPKTPSTEDLLLGWSGYRLMDNLWARVITPSSVVTGNTTCEPGMSDCNAVRPDTDPLIVPNCPQDTDKTTSRLVQVNDLFDGEDLMSNIDGTLLTFGAHRLVFLKQDSQGNAGFCRFTAYVRREDRGRAQSCDVLDGLDPSLITSCETGNKGRKVQCSPGSVAPLSPKVLTCGKLGSYNLHNPDRRPAAVVCGATSSFKFKVTITLRYQLGVDCTSGEEQDLAKTLKTKVQELDKVWPGLCPGTDCDTADTSDVKCQSSSSRMVVVMIVLQNVAATLTKDTTTLTAKELLETATKEFTPSAFAIPDSYNAQLQTNDAVIDAEPTCDAGQGLHDGVCVVCTKGSFLNETSEMCQLCPVGSYTSIDEQTQCTQCPDVKTTLQLGANTMDDCVLECAAGTSYNRNDPKCEPCPKNFYNNKTGQEYCTPCPAGKATQTVGASMLSLCFDTCPAGTQLNGSDCVPCPRGMYSDGVQHEICVSCPVGNTTANTGSTSLSSCHQTACEPGNYRDSDTNTCMECDYGSYQPEKWQDMCMPCNTSYTTENKGSTSAQQCMFVCEAGKENLSGTMCSPCKKGFYRDGSVEQRFMNCTACNDTFTTEGESSNSADDCKIRMCHAGSYRNETDNECYACPMGEYQPDSLQTACLTCPRNLTTEQESSDNMTQCVFYCAEGYQVMSAEKETCQACERGKYKTNVGAAKFGMCQSCTVNQFTDDEASVSAAYCSIPKCEAGQDIMGIGCLNCPVNTYQPMANPKSSTDCMACGPGKGTKEDKRTSLTDCLPVCDAGNQYNMTMMSCQLCPLGTFNTGNDTQRFEQCEACPVGYVTVGEMMGATSIDNCTLRDCPPGMYISGSGCLSCPVGTYQDIPRQTTCKACRENTNTSGEGKADANECTISCFTGQEQEVGSENCIPCREDHVKETPGPGRCDQCKGNFTANDVRTDCDVLFCDKGFKYNAAGPPCDPCEMGTYKDMRANATECMPCPTNTTTAGVASTSVGDCNKAKCDKGFYSPDDTLPCLACPVGKYKNATGNMNCTDCSAGLTTDSVASTEASQCSLNICPVGQYRDMVNQCVNCAVGFYQNETGQTECMMCPTGYTTGGTGADNQNDCKIVCSAGLYRNDTTNMCEQCPVGQYQESEGQTECSMCSADYTTADAGSNSSTDCYVICPSGSAATARDSCEKCPHGQYQSADNANACKACDSGYTTLATGSTSAEQCQPICTSGQFLNKTSRMCMPCPLGTYNGKAGTNTTAEIECTACPEGNTTSTTGAETLSSCSIPDCLAGSFRSSNGGCQECEVGTYQPEKSQTSCISCDKGNTTLLPGRDDSKYCVLTCPDGKAYMQASGTCVECKIGFYRKASPNDTDCIRCPSGTTTITPGKDICVEEAQGTVPAVRNVKIVVRVKIRLRVKPCGRSDYNKNQLGTVITDFILRIMEILDMRFPAICVSRDNKNCVNVKIKFKVGCLQNFSSRRKRQTDPEENEVEIEVSGVDSEVEDNATKQIHDSAVAIERAFYDSQVQEKNLNNNDIEYLGVDNVASVYEPVPGQGPLKSDGTPAGSVDLVSPGASGFTYGPCPNGTYSTDGTECVSCAKNTYQDQTGQTSCKDCPGKTFTTSTGAKAESQCGKKCEEDNADATYCSGQGSCSYDPATSNGVRCICKEGFEGISCTSRKAPTSDKTTMVAGIAGGAGAFLVLLIIIVGIVACLRHKAKKGKKESSEGTESKQVYENEAYADYAHPMFASPSSRALPGQPSLVFYNPEAYDQEVRDFYHTGRSSGPPSRRT